MCFENPITTNRMYAYAKILRKHNLWFRETQRFSNFYDNVLLRLLLVAIAIFCGLFLYVIWWLVYVFQAPNVMSTEREQKSSVNLKSSHDLTHTKEERFEIKLENISKQNPELV